MADDLLPAQELGQRQHHVGGGDARLRPPGQLHPGDVGQAHPRGAAEHHVLRLQPADADRDHAQRVHVRGVAVGADAGVGEGHAVAGIDHRRHFLQVDLVHDPVARRDHLHVAERVPGPFDEVEAVGIAAVLDGAVLGERIGIVAAAFHRQRVVDDQLHRHHRIDLGRVAALLGDGVAQAGQVDQRGLAEDVVADHAHREPGEIQVASALDELQQVVVQPGRIGAAHQVLGVHARGIGKRGPGAGAERFDRFAGVEPVQGRAGRGWAGEGFAVSGVHGGGAGSWAGSRSARGGGRWVCTDSRPPPGGDPCRNAASRPARAETEGLH